MISTKQCTNNLSLTFRRTAPPYMTLSYNLWFGRYERAILYRPLLAVCVVCIEAASTGVFFRTKKEELSSRNLTKLGSDWVNADMCCIGRLTFSASPNQLLLVLAAIDDFC